MTNCAQPLYVVRWLCWMVFIILCLCKFQSNPMECASNPDFSCLEWHLILLPLWLIDSITFFNSIYWKGSKFVQCSTDSQRSRIDWFSSEDP